MAMNVNDFNLLIQWGFQLFDQLSPYKDEEDFIVAFNFLISQQQFQLISKLMSKESKLSSQEIFEVFQLGDKFLVSGQAKENIFSLLVKLLSSEEISIRELPYLNLWNDFTIYLKYNSAIEIDGYTIKLNGLKIRPKENE